MYSDIVSEKSSVRKLAITIHYNAYVNYEYANVYKIKLKVYF